MYKNFFGSTWNDPSLHKRKLRILLSEARVQCYIMWRGKYRSGRLDIIQHPFVQKHIS